MSAPIPGTPAAPAAPAAAAEGTPPAGQPAPPAPANPPVIPPGATVAGMPGAVPPVPPTPQASEGLPNDPDELKKIIARLTTEAAGHRVAKNEIEAGTQAAIAAAVQQAQTEQAQAIGKALGLIRDDATTVTPEQLTEQFTVKESGYQAEIKKLRIENALAGALSGTHPGARDALIGSGKLADLDPEAADFGTKLKAAVDDYLTANPYFRVSATPVQPQAGTSGANFTGSTPATPGESTSIDELRRQRQERRGIKF